MDSVQSTINRIVDVFQGTTMNDIVRGLAYHLVWLYEDGEREDAVKWLNTQWEISNDYNHWDGDLLEDPIEDTQIRYMDSCFRELLKKIDCHMRAPVLIAAFRIRCHNLTLDILSRRFVIMLEITGQMDCSDYYYIGTDMCCGFMSRYEHEDFVLRVSNSLPYGEKTSHLSDELSTELLKRGITGTETPYGRLWFEIQTGNAAPCLVTISECPGKVTSYHIDCSPMYSFARQAFRMKYNEIIDDHLARILGHQLHPDADTSFAFDHQEGVLHIHAITFECYRIYSVVLALVNEMLLYSRTIADMIDYYQTEWEEVKYDD